MKIPIFYVDTFTDKIFTGNPAAVCIVEEMPLESIIDNIVTENNLPATVFLKRDREGFAIRWFTPRELDFCGHGTLAAAYVVFNFLEPQRSMIQFYSKKEVLSVHRTQDFITIVMLGQEIEPQQISALSRKELGLEVEDVFGCVGERCVFVLKTEEEVKNLQPDFSVLKKLNYRGFVFTAPGNEFDFVSRTFYPDKKIPEDYVTGVSHRFLAPYWAKRLNKNILKCYQASSRGGFLKCEVQGNKLFMSSEAVLYMQGVITL